MNTLFFFLLFFLVLIPAGILLFQVMHAYGPEVRIRREVLAEMEDIERKRSLDAAVTPILYGPRRVK